MSCPVFFNLFYEGSWQGGVLKVMKNNHFLVFLAVWGFFPQVFGQIKVWLMLELHEMIRLLHAVACSIVFSLFYEESWPGVVLQVMKNGHF